MNARGEVSRNCAHDIDVARGTGIGVGAIVHGCYARTAEAIGFENLALKLYDEKYNVENGDALETLSEDETAAYLAAHAPSLGGVETLVSEPRLTSHKSLTPEERSQAGIPDGFLRFSLGLEDADDLIADFAQALAQL